MDQRPNHAPPDDPPSIEALVWQHQARLNSIDRRLDRIEHQLWLVLMGIVAVLGGLIAQALRM